MLSACFAALALVGSALAVPPLMVLMGLSFYMIHNTLQTSATQMAPEARGLGVSLFAFALFIGQSIGVAAAAPIMDQFGAPPIFMIAALMLPFVAVWFQSQLSIRPS